MSKYKLLLRDYFSIQIKVLRRKRDLTQEEMAEHLHITSRAYSDLERGCLLLCYGAFVLFIDVGNR